MKQVLIINGHPDKQSYNYALSKAYKEGLNKTKITISEINISDLNFNPNLEYGYRKRTELESDLKEAINKIKKANHIVWFFPVWWAGLPALIKGFIDRTFLPGIMFEFEEGKEMPLGLLKGKSASVYITSDTPEQYDIEVMKQPVLHQFKTGVLEYCGVSPVEVTYISTITGSSDSFRKKWLNKMNEFSKDLK